MSRGPGWLFVAGLAVFALLGLLAGSPPPRAVRANPVGGEVHGATDAPPAHPPAGHLDRPALNSIIRRSPRELARSWGRAWASWSAQTLADQLALLMKSASPRLAAELRDALRMTEATAPEQTGSRGTVEAVQVGPGNAARRIIVVTREALYGPAGPDPAGSRYRVYVGSAVRERPGDWKMSRWARQP